MGSNMIPETMADGVRFELTKECNPLPVFKTGALNRSATHPCYDYRKFKKMPQEFFNGAQ